MRAFNSANKFLFGHDIFISYSRKDGLDYAYKLAEHFITHGYDCFIDQLMSTTPGKELPRNILRALKRSTALVVVGTEGASGSEPIKKEIESFLSFKKNNPLVIIDDNKVSMNAVWYSSVQGLPLIEEDPGAIKGDTPSQNIISRITNSLTFTRKSKRLRIVSFAVLAATMLLSVLLIFQFTAAGKLRSDNQKQQARLDATQINLKRSEDSLTTAKAEIKQAISEVSSLKLLKDGLEKDKGKLNDANKKLTYNISIANLDLKKKQDELAEASKEFEAVQIANTATGESEINPTKAVKLALSSYSIKKNKQAASLLIRHFNEGNMYYARTGKNLKNPVFSKDGFLVGLDTAANLMKLFNPLLLEAVSIGSKYEFDNAVFIQDDSLICAEGIYSLKIFDRKGNLLTEYPTGEIKGISLLKYFSKEDKIVFCYEGKGFIISNTKKEIKRFSYPGQHPFSYERLSFLSNAGNPDLFTIARSDGTLFKISFEGKLLDSVAVGFDYREMKSPKRDYRYMTSLLGGKYIVGQNRDTIRIFNTSSLYEVASFVKPRDYLEVSESEKYFAIAMGQINSEVSIYDAEKYLSGDTNYRPVNLKESDNHFLGITFSPDDKYVTLAKSTGELSVYNMQGELLANCRANHLGSPYLVAVKQVLWNKKSTGFLTYGYSDKESFYWDINTLKANSFNAWQDKFSTVYKVNEAGTLVAMSAAELNSFSLMITNPEGIIKHKFKIPGIKYESVKEEMSFSENDNFFRWIVVKDNQLDTFYFDLAGQKKVAKPPATVFKGFNNRTKETWEVRQARSLKGLTQLYLVNKAGETILLNCKQQFSRSLTNYVHLENNLVVFMGRYYPEIFLIDQDRVVDILRQYQAFY